MIVRRVILVAAVAVLVEGHIHSQKVRHVERVSLNTWLYAVCSSVVVGSCGVFPLLVNRWVRLDGDCHNSVTLKSVLSFAVGGLLGDVFLHLLPEAWNLHHASGGWEGMIGLWVLAGLLVFMLVEKLVKITAKDESCSTDIQDYPKPFNAQDLNGVVLKGSHINGFVRLNGCKERPAQIDTKTSSSHVKSPWQLEKHVSGYLNLVANCMDNFTHGLAIAASYVANPTVGVLTTLAILCHEIPHEIGDFAILLNSGFDHRQAAILQMVTAFGGVIGVMVGLGAEHVSNASAGWLLPFTAGGFLYIALVSIIPELLEDTNLTACVTQLLGVVTGVVVMAMVTIVEKESCSHMPLTHGQN